MASSVPSPTSSPSPSSSSETPMPPASPVTVPVFAPRPLRLPHSYHSSLQRSILLDRDPPTVRTPSPATSWKSLQNSADLHQRSSSGGSIKLTISPGPDPSGEGLGQIRVYSPSHDCLDDFFKIVQQQGNRGRRNDSPLSIREILDGSSNQRNRSDTSSKDIREGELGSGSRFPSSPVSRTLTRNPIIYNSQFDSQKQVLRQE
ncbi:hypothetical protein EDC01DRAFT_538019 [Geopyxis carbonaria]|nr:hypothetical protein EDC01DRAFT_538019 [Geopyxis carbonaria]